MQIRHAVVSAVVAIGVSCSGIAAASATSAHPATPAVDRPAWDAQALAALQQQAPGAAAKALKKGLAAANEPAAAKVYARRALRLIAAGNGGAAGVPLTKGAGVEYLTFALDALRGKHPRAAADDLMNAEKLPPAKAAAHKALGAIATQHIPAALADIRAGLTTLQP